MKIRTIIIIGIFIAPIILGLIWVQMSPHSEVLIPKSSGPSSPPTLAPASSKPQQDQLPSAEPIASPNISANVSKPFATMGALEANEIVAMIMKQDYPAIMQSWLDAGHIEHDLMKQQAIASQLGGVMRQTPANPEFLDQLHQFISNHSNLELERDMLLGSLTYAGTAQTEAILIEIATSATDEVTRSAMGDISILGTSRGGGIQEELAPALDQLWMQSNDQHMLLSVSMAMAQVGAPSSMELLLVAALAPEGQDVVRRQAARYALGTAQILNPNAVPTLVARLSNDSPAIDPSKYASSILSRIGVRVADQTLVVWLQAANSSAEALARDYSSHTQFPEIWQATLDPSMQFRSEQNREAIRKGLAEHKAGIIFQPVPKPGSGQ